MRPLLSIADSKLRRLALTTASLTAAALSLMGCAYGDREMFFESRAAVVLPIPGDGSSRVAMWPSNTEGHATLVRGKSDQATDIAGR